MRTLQSFKVDEAQELPLRERVDALRNQLAGIRYQQAQAREDALIARVGKDRKAAKAAAARLAKLEEDAAGLVAELENIVASLRAGWDIVGIAGFRAELAKEADRLRGRIDAILPIIAGFHARGQLGELPTEAVHQLQQLALCVEPMEIPNDSHPAEDLSDAVEGVGYDAQRLQEVLDIDARLWTIQTGRIGLEDPPAILKHTHGGREIGILVAIFQSIRLSQAHRHPEARLPGLPPTAARQREVEALRREDRRRFREQERTKQTRLVRPRPSWRGSCPADLLEE